MIRFFPRQSFKIWLLLVFLAPVLVVSVRHLQFSNAVEKWLPQDSPEARTFDWYQEVFGRDEFALLSWDGSSLDDSRVEFLAKRLETHPEILRCQTPGRLIQQMEAVNIPRPEAIRRLEGVLVGPGGTPTGIAVFLSPAGAKDREATINLIRTVADQEAGIRYDAIDETRNELHLGGAPVANSELDVWSRDSLRRLLPIATAVCVVLTFVSLRSLGVGVVVLVTSYYSVLAAMALVSGTGASLNLLMVIIPSLVLVVGLSGSIHLVNYWRFALRSGREGAVARAWAMAWRPCVFACVTTAIGLGSLATSRITPVREFGIYAGLGVLLTLALILTALPAGLQLLKRSRVADAPSDASDTLAADASNGQLPMPQDTSVAWQRFAGWVTRRGVPVAAICFLCFALAATGLVRSRTEIRPIRYFPNDSRIVRDYSWIESRLGGLVPVETVIRFRGNPGEMDTLSRLGLVRAIEARIKELPEVAGTLSLASLTPTIEPSNVPGGRLVANGTLNAGIQGRKQQIRSLFVDGKEEQLWRITALTRSLGSINYAEFVATVEAIVPEVIRDFPDAPGAPDVIRSEFTGLVPLVMHAQHEVLRGLIISFAVAFGVIGLVMVVLLRSAEAGMLAMVPNLTPVVAVFGVLGWGGIPIDIGTMMTASVALGIGVDGTLHLLTWFNRGLGDGMSRLDATRLALTQSGPAIVKTSLIAGLGLMVLGASPFLPTQRFGLLMAGLLGASVLGGVVFLPALLASPAGYILERTARRIRPAALPGFSRRDGRESVVCPSTEFAIDEAKAGASLRAGRRAPPRS
jgi:hypothetical protein